MKQVNLQNIDTAARMLKTIAHPVRLRIIILLSNEKRLSVGEIQRKLKAVQSTISQHLLLLKNVGILKCDKDDNVRYYYIANKSIYGSCQSK